MYDGYTDKSGNLLDLSLVEGTMDRVENGSLRASGFQILVEVARAKDDHIFSAVFTYESEGWFFNDFVIISKAGRMLRKRCSSK